MMALFSSLEVFKERNARILLVSQLLSQICDKIMSIGLVWYITQHFEATYLPWYLFFGFLPHLLFFPWTASWINRIGLLRTVIGADLFRGLIFLALFFITRNSLPDQILPFLFVGVFIVGIGTSFFNPALMSLPPQLVSDKNISSLNTLLDLCFSVSHIVAATISIWLLQIADISTLMLMNAGLFTFGAFYQSRIQLGTTSNSISQDTADSHSAIVSESLSDLDKSSSEKAVSLIKNFSMMLGILKRNPIINMLIILFFILNVAMAPLFVFRPWYAKNVFGNSASALAWLESGWAAGALSGGLILLAIQIKNHTHFLKFLYTMVSGFGMIFILFSMNRKLEWAMLLMLSMGILISVLNVNILTYFQKTLAENELSYVMTMANLIGTASIPLSMMASGLLMQKISVPQLAFYSGIMVFIISMFFRTISKNSDALKPNFNQSGNSL